MSGVVIVEVMLILVYENSVVFALLMSPSAIIRG